MIRHNPPVPTPSVQIEPYTGPVDQVLDRILEAQTAGRLLRTHPLQRLDNGTVLVITELRPATEPAPDTEQAPGGKRSRFANWPVYYWAALAPFALAVAGVLVFLFIAGLRAVVVWGMANALMIGAVVLVTFLVVLVFLGALAKARHGHGHPGGYPRRY